MDITKLTTSDLKQITKLLEKKEALQAQLEEIDHALVRFAEVKGPEKRRARKSPDAGGAATGGAGRGRKSKVKDDVITLLKQAGANGLTIPEMAEKLGLKETSLRAWFSTTGKKIESIEKVGTAQFAWRETSS